EGHDHGAMEEHMAAGAVMPGMATPEQMEQLRSLEGEEADILYLQLMTTHHIAGVDMAQAALDGGVDGEVRRLAAAMVNGQESEIDLMTDMLHARGAQTLEEGGADHRRVCRVAQAGRPHRSALRAGSARLGHRWGRASSQRVTAGADPASRSPRRPGPRRRPVGRPAGRAAG